MQALLESVAEKKPSTQHALCRFEDELHVSTGTRHRYSPSKNGLNEVPLWTDVGFYQRQERVILRNCGTIDPRSIEEAIARGAYRGAYHALGMQPEKVIDDTALRSPM